MHPVPDPIRILFYFQQQSLWGLMSHSSTSCDSCSVVCQKDVLKKLLGQKILAFLCFFETLFCWNWVPFRTFLSDWSGCVRLDSESQNHQIDLCPPSDWSLCIKLRGWPMAQRQGRASSSNSSKAQDRWTSAHRFSSTSSSLVRINLKCTQYTFCYLWVTHIMPSYLSLWVNCIPGSCVSDASRALPEFPDIDLQGKSLPEGVELEHIKSFQLLYREHCEVKPTLPERALKESKRRNFSQMGRCVTF